jgi:long-chain acyl-CoA synthetase
MMRGLLLNKGNWGKTAIIEDGRETTYGSLAHKAFALGEKLQSLKRGNVAILLPNGGDYVAALFGALMAGDIAFPLSDRLTGHEIGSLLRKADISAAVTSRAFRPALEGFEGGAKILYVEDIQPQPNIPTCYWPDPLSPMVMLATSGTTGKAKIAVLSEKNIESVVFGYCQKMPFEALGEDEIRYILAMPFSSAYGMFVLFSLALKGYPAILAGNFTLDALYRAAEERKATHFEGSSTAIAMMARSLHRHMPYDVRSLRYYGFGGSGVSAEALKKLSAAFPWAEFWMGYGMTEASPLIAKSFERMPAEKMGSAGPPLPGVEIMVEAAGRITNEPWIKGEVLVRGANVMIGYYKNAHETQKALRGGWLHTGDVGYLDEEGWLFLCGRAKNVILSRGFTIYPEEVEAAILESGLASDCIVYGAEDGYGGERVCCDCVPSKKGLQEEDIQNWCRQRLADYKRPKTVRLVESVPKTHTGKQKRNESLETD